MGKIRNFLCFFICSFHLNCPTTEEQITDRQVLLGEPKRFCYILYILRNRRNDVDSIIIKELAYYCFSSHFFTHLIALICSLSLNLESSFVSFPSRTAS